MLDEKSEVKEDKKLKSVGYSIGRLFSSRSDEVQSLDIQIECVDEKKIPLLRMKIISSCYREQLVIPSDSEDLRSLRYRSG